MVLFFSIGNNNTENLYHSFLLKTEFIAFCKKLFPSYYAYKSLLSVCVCVSVGVSVSPAHSLFPPHPLHSIHTHTPQTHLNIAYLFDTDIK